mmetsp:Transcript_49101/g.95980  ORF Transcript_49101/g.95980 Transcript_49101/m.95980 type:complete len:95 (+) Transcript_49101:1427-1711(+)
MMTTPHGVSQETDTLASASFINMLMKRGLNGHRRELWVAGCLQMMWTRKGNLRMYRKKTGLPTELFRVHFDAKEEGDIMFVDLEDFELEDQLIK